MTKSMNGKALGAFKKLGAVALITATLAVCFTACNQTGGGGGKPTPKHAINFSVDITTPNGTLKAKADGVDETSTSPINVEEGKTVTFTAEPSANYKVKEWKVDDTVVANNKTNTYIHTVKKAVTVKVSFESNSNPPNPPTPTKYTVTLTQAEGGKVTASPEIPEDKKVDKDTEITFTAEANEGYKIGKWTVTPAEALQDGTGADGSETAKVKITADTTVKVSFELIPVEGGAVLILSPDKLNIKVNAKTADGSAITVGGCTETTLASNTETTLTAKGTKVILKGKITNLYCYQNQLTALNVQGLTALQELKCGDNQLTELNVQGLTALQELYCWDNKLTALNVQGCTSLQRLACGGNHLSELNVQGCASLQELYCNGNQLTEVNVQGCASLVRLDCYGNKLTALNVQGLTSLQELHCYQNQLTELNVQGCTALQKLWCNNNQLPELNVQGLNRLQRLSCSRNKLNAQAMTELLNALPARNENNYGEATLYTEQTDVTEGNCKDYSKPEDLKKAVDEAKKRKWKLQKINISGDKKEI